MTKSNKATDSICRKPAPVIKHKRFHCSGVCTSKALHFSAWWFLDEILWALAFDFLLPKKNWFVARILKWFHLLFMFEWGNKFRNALKIWTFFYLNQPRLTSRWTHWSLKLDKKIQPKEKTLKDLLMLCRKLKNSTIIQALSKYQNKHWSLYKSISLLSYNIITFIYLIASSILWDWWWWWRQSGMRGMQWFKINDYNIFILDLSLMGKQVVMTHDADQYRIELNWISSDPVHCHITKSKMPPTSFLYE